MDLDKFNSLNNTNEPKNNFFDNVIKNFQNVLEGFIKNPISSDSICVITDINDEKLSLVNIDTGEDFDIYISSSTDTLDKLHKQGISDNIYTISKEDLYSLNLGSNIILKNAQCHFYQDNIEITNKDALAKLEDLYFCLEQEKNAEYLISNINNGKIFLTNTKEGGCFSILQEAYPNFKIGDIVKNVNGKYVLI